MPPEGADDVAGIAMFQIADTVNVRSHAGDFSLGRELRFTLDDIHESETGSRIGFGLAEPNQKFRTETVRPLDVDMCFVLTGSDNDRIC